MMHGHDHPKEKTETKINKFFDSINSPSILTIIKKFLTKCEQDITCCSKCGSKDKEIDVHFVDEDCTNLIPSNLEPICNECHTILHDEQEKYSLPFISIGKTMRFASAHRLPRHQGKCKNLHGHEWNIEVVIRKRIDPRTGMVMDFKDLKTAINDFIITPLDHDVLNHHLENPTAENLLIWVWQQLMFKASLKGIEKITIWESPDSTAVLDAKGMASTLFSESGS